MSDDVWIATRSGRRFTPLAPKVDQIDLEDIAHALSKVCRYTGQCDRFYSVAEHSVRVYWATLRVSAGLHVRRWALMHDATEAYLADVAAPLKSTEQFSGYRALEKQLERTIAKRFDLLPEMPDEVKQADRLLLASEWGELMTNTLRPWGGEFPEADLDLVQGLGWTPAKAATAFSGLAHGLGLGF